MTSAFFQRYEKARTACVIFHLQDWALFQLSGSDAQDYLNRISTADVKGCGPGDARQTLFLNGDGRMVADCALLCENNEQYYLACPAACREGLAEQLDRFLFAEKVKFEDVSNQYYLAMIAGPGADQIAAQVATVCAEVNADHQVYKIEFAPQAPRMLVLIAAEAFPNVRGAIYELVERSGGVIGDIDLYATFRIEEGCPQFGSDTSAKTIPLEAGLNSAVSFTKGCFPGQEIVARINNLGHPANILVGLMLPDTTEQLAGRELAAGGKTVGRITSVCYSPALKNPLALGYVKWNLREVGQTLDVAGDEGFTAVVVELPVPGINL